MSIKGQGDGIAHIRIHRESLGGVNSLDQIPNVKSIYLQHDNGFYEYNIRRIEVDPVDSNAFLLAVKQEHPTVPTGSASSATIFTPYIAGKFKNSDYEPLLSNAIDGEPTYRFLTVDNNASQLVPTNIDAINNRTAGYAQIQNSNYEVESYSGPRYKGTKHTATDFNIASTQTGVPPVSDTQTYFAYFNWIGGTTPDIQNKTGASIKYYIDLDGNIVKPTNDEITLSIVEQNFKADKDVEITLNDVEYSGNNMSSLQGYAKVLAAGKRIENIISTLDGTFYNAVTASSLYFTNIDTGAHYSPQDPPGWSQGSDLQSITQSFASYVLDTPHIFLGISGNDIDETDLMNTGNSVYYKPVSPSGTGYQKPSLQFEIKLYDRIVFIKKNNSYITAMITDVRRAGGTYYLKLDKEVVVGGSTGVEPKGYSIYRFVDAAGSILLNKNKPGGATSGGIIKPKYMPEGAEEKIRDIIDDLEQKGII